jgi:uncharacterized coiled-coil protein SlyX
MSTFGSTTEDADGVPKNMDRGPVAEDWKSPEELRAAMRLIVDAKEVMGKTATIEGLAQQVSVLKQQLAMTHEQMQSLIGIYGTLQNEFTQFRAQRTIELQSWIAKNGGSTTPEDHI